MKMKILVELLSKTGTFCTLYGKNGTRTKKRDCPVKYGTVGRPENVTRKNEDLNKKSKTDFPESVLPEHTRWLISFHFVALKFALSQIGGKWREGNSVLLYGCILEGLHLYGCVYRELTPIWVCF